MDSILNKTNPYAIISLILAILLACTNNDKNEGMTKTNTKLKKDTTAKVNTKQQKDTIIISRRKKKPKKLSHKQKIQNALPKQITKFIPDDYELYYKASGNLNLDENPDLILVLNKIGERNAKMTEKIDRPLLILLGNKDSTYQLVKRNDKVVRCLHCSGLMGDPFEEMNIKDGTISIYHYGGTAWRWARKTVFKYSKTEKDWYLEREELETFHINRIDEFESTKRSSKDFGKVAFEDYHTDNIY